MLKSYAADLHIHTALSPCAEDEMTPRNILRTARDRGLDLIAVTDHNSAENAGAVMKAANEFGVTVWPGMEVQTREEVHVVCLFDRLEPALAWQTEVHRHLPDLPNRPEYFGNQRIMDSEGRIVGENPRLLLTATGFSVEDVARRVEELGGVAIPAHVDRPSFSLLGTLGLIPAEPKFPALEISRRITPEEAVDKFPELNGRVLYKASDAHRLPEISEKRTVIFLAEPDLAEFRKACRREDGRRIIVQ